jgi:hypothetical protein
MLIRIENKWVWSLYRHIFSWKKAETNAYRHMLFLAEWPCICLFVFPTLVTAPYCLAWKCIVRWWPDRNTLSWKYQPERSSRRSALHAIAKECRIVNMWRGIASLPAAEQLYGQIMKLAQIGMTLVGTSVSDERAFAAMTFVKNCLRSALTTHLPLCMRMKLQEEYDLSSFPYHLLP